MSTSRRQRGSPTLLGPTPVLLSIGTAAAAVVTVVAAATAAVAVTAAAAATVAVTAVTAAVTAAGETDHGPQGPRSTAAAQQQHQPPEGLVERPATTTAGMCLSGADLTGPARPCERNGGTDQEPQEKQMGKGRGDAGSMQGVWPLKAGGAD